MGTEPGPLNYFNYFTEVEEHFQRVRGTSLFLLSSLDWALLASWKEAEVPLEAVLRGIEIAFEKWRAKKTKTQMVNSLAFCAQAVLTEAKIMAGTAPARRERPAAAPFSLEELRGYLERTFCRGARCMLQVSQAIRVWSARGVTPRCARWYDRR